MIYVPKNPRAKQYSVPPLQLADWVYIACFLDTDGCIYIDRKRNRPQLSWANNYRPVLEWMREVLGVGGVYEVLKPDTSRATFKRYHSNYQYQIKHQMGILGVLSELLPHLRIKEKAAEEVIVLLHTKRLLPPKQS